MVVGTCPPMGEPWSGSVEFNMPPFANGSYPEETTAEFSCDDTFMLHGLERLTCQTLGYWNDYAPICNKIGKEINILIY